VWYRVTQTGRQHIWINEASEKVVIRVDSLYPSNGVRLQVGDEYILISPHVARQVARALEQSADRVEHIREDEE